MRTGAQRPRLQSFPTARTGSCGIDAVEYGESLGYELDDWQKWLIDGVFSEDDAYRLCATLCLIILPRQNGKNVVLEVVELYAFYVLGWPVIVHTAHRADTSADHMARLVVVIEANPELAEITTIYNSNGKERIYRTDTKAEIRFVTRSKKIGRGKSPRMVVFDEALYLTDDQVQAILPSMSAQSMNADPPLMIYTSSAAVEESAVMHRIRDACIAGVMPSAFFAEWSCDPDNLDIADREQWRLANPSLNVRINEDWVAENELAILSEEAFMVERLGVPVMPRSATVIPAAIPADAWQATATTVPVDVQPGACVFAFDVHDGWASIAIAAGTLSASYVEVVAHQAGDGWLPRRLIELAERWKPTGIGLDGGCGQAVAALGVIREQFEEAGLDPDLVRPLTSANYKEACGSFLRSVIDGTLTRPVVAPDQLDNAAVVASERRIGDAFVWDRRTATVPLAPLVAATVARSLLGDKPTPATPFFMY